MSISKTLSEALSNLMESSLGRIYQHHKERAFVILTAWRANRTLEDNRAALKGLKKQVRGAGYGFIQLEGVGQEKVKGKLVEASEPSLLVPNNTKGKDDGTLIKKALGWARKPGGDSKAAQDFIFYHNGEGDSAVVNVKSGGTDFKLTKFKPGGIGPFYSRLSGGRTFKYEWAGVKYADPPSGWIHGMGRESEGELFEFCETIDQWQEDLGF